MIRSLNLPKVFSGISIPAPVQKYIKPMLLASIGLHALVLLAPLPSEPLKPKVAQQKQKTVKLTSLPSIRKATPSLSKPRPVAKTLPQTRAVTLPQKGLTIPRPVRKKAVVAALPHKSKPTAAQPPQKTPAQTPSPDNTSPNNGPMSDFPIFPGATPGCLGLPSCYSASSSLAEVSQFFEKELPAKKYTVQPSASEPERKVYQVSKGGESQYLTLLVDGATIQYVLGSQPQTQKDLRNAVQIPEDFNTNIMSKVGSDSGGDSGSTSDVTPEQFATPTDFFTSLGGVGSDGFDVNPELKPEVSSLKRVPSQTPQQIYDTSFSAALTQSGYQATPVSTGYSGGLLYEIKKGTFKPFYLNLVPTKDGKDTVVAVWVSKPS
jgi:hypothetical protein